MSAEMTWCGNNEKNNPLWSQEVKEAIRGKKVAYQAWI